MSLTEERIKTAEAPSVPAAPEKPQKKKRKNKTKHQKEKQCNSAIIASISNVILTEHWFFVLVAVWRDRFH